jgi:regulator of replication initiation timing
MGKIADFVGRLNVALAGQQITEMVELDQQFVSLESQVKSLKMENGKLSEENATLKKQVQGRQQALKPEHTKEKNPVQIDLDEEEQNVLRVFAESRFAISCEQIAVKLGTTPQIAQVHIGRMIDRGFVEVEPVMRVDFMRGGSQTRYIITSRGSARAAVYGLLPGQNK